MIPVEAPTSLRGVLPTTSISTRAMALSCYLSKKSAHINIVQHEYIISVVTLDSHT